jgi:hypothetical protein
MNKKICIPRVDEKYSIEYITTKINEFQIGEIISIKEIPLKNEKKYKRILITIKWDNTREIVNKMENILNTIGSVKLVYDMPWYWKIVETKLSNNYKSGINPIE